MGGAESQAAFHYQNLHAALELLTMIEQGSSLLSVTLENPDKAEHIDDIILEYAKMIRYVQIKWGKSETSSFTLANLCKPDNAGKGKKKPSLLAKMAKGWKQAHGTPKSIEVVLLSNRPAGTNKQPSQGFPRSLQEFLDDLLSPWQQTVPTVALNDAAQYETYKSTLDQMRRSTGLDKEEQEAFLRVLRFELGYPGLEELKRNIPVRLQQLGIDDQLFDRVVNTALEWSIAQRRVQRDDVLRKLGLHMHFVETLVQSFPVNSELWVPRPELLKALDDSINVLPGGFVLLEGPAGSGKSTALSMFDRTRPEVRLGHYCYVPDERELGYPRLERETLLRTLCIGIHNAFPDIEFPHPFAPHDKSRLNELLRVIAAKHPGKVAIFIDGLDHVHRAHKHHMVDLLWGTVINGRLPDGVFFLLSSRYDDALSDDVCAEIDSDPRRRIRVDGLNGVQTSAFLRKRGLPLDAAQVQRCLLLTDGLPIYLEYLSDLLAKQHQVDQKRFLEELPALQGGDIDAFHRHQWATWAKDDLLVYILGILARRRATTSTRLLLGLLRQLGVQTNRLEVGNKIRELRHVLYIYRVDEARLRHVSLGEFINQRVEELGIAHDINRSLIAMYDSEPDGDDAWRHRFRHLAELGEDRRLLQLCTNSWVERAHRHWRPLSEIAANLDQGWRAAVRLNDLDEVVRVALIRQALGLRVSALEQVMYDEPLLLLDIGATDAALAAIWDGRTVLRPAAEVARFLLRWLELHDDLPPLELAQTAFGGGEALCDSLVDISDTLAARAMSESLAELLEEINELQPFKTNSYDEVQREALSEGDMRTVRKNMVGRILYIARKCKRFGELRGLRKQLSIGSVWQHEVHAAQALMSLSIRDGNWSADIAALGWDDLSSATRLELVRTLVLSADPHTLPSGLPSSIDLPEDLLDDRLAEVSPTLYSIFDRLCIAFLVDPSAYISVALKADNLGRPLATLLSNLVEAAQTWARSQREELDPRDSCAAFARLITGLNLREGDFHTLGTTKASIAHHGLKREAHTLGLPLFRAVAELDLPLRVLAEAWLSLDDRGVLASSYELACGIARLVHKQGDPGDQNLVVQLLTRAEALARDNRDTTNLTGALLEILRTEAVCGQSEQTQQRWFEVLESACGVYYRKDHQLMEILDTLRHAHKHRPVATRERLTHVLEQNAKLASAVQSKTTAVGVELICAFSAEHLDAQTAFALQQSQDAVLWRTRSLARIIPILAQQSDPPWRHLWALGLSMERWDNPSGFNDETWPTMTALLEACLKEGEHDLVCEIYCDARSIVLVEKNRPELIGHWAMLLQQAGIECEYVAEDAALHAASSYQTTGPDHHAELTELGQAVLAGLDAFERCYADILNRERKSDLRWTLASPMADWWRLMSLDRKEEATSKAIEDAETALGDALIAAHESTDWSPTGHQILDEVHTILRSLGAVLKRDDLAEELMTHLDLAGWAEAFEPASLGRVQLQASIAKRGLPVWIRSAPEEDLDYWAQFCQEQFRDWELSHLLVDLSKRWAENDPAKAVSYLRKAWETCADSLYFDHSLVRRLFDRLFRLDLDTGQTLLLQSFYQYYRRYPSSLIQGLGHLVERAYAFPGSDSERLYELQQDYNDHLVAGLPSPQIDTSMLQAPTPVQDSRTAVLGQLLWTLGDPVVNVGLSTLSALYDLMARDDIVVDEIATHWTELNDTQRQLVLLAFHALALHGPSRIEPRLPLMLQWAEQEHLHIRQAIKEIAECVAHAGFLGGAMTARFQALNTTGQVVASPPLLLAPVAPMVRPPAYLFEVICHVEQRFPTLELPVRLLQAMAARVPDLKASLNEQLALVKRKNWNANFDPIEIEGEFDRHWASVMNQQIAVLVPSGLSPTEARTSVARLLRRADPTDLLRLPAGPPDEATWLANGSDDAGFLAFDDRALWPEILRDAQHEWTTLFTHVIERGPEGHASRSIRRARVEVLAVAAPKGQVPSEAEVLSLIRAMPEQQNVYRSELPPISSATQAAPHLLVTRVTRCYRGEHDLPLAWPVPVLINDLGAIKRPTSIDFDDQLGEPVARTLEWQGPWSQGRRRQRPTCEGIELQVATDRLQEWLDQKDLTLWYVMFIRRTTERYGPEQEMDWQKHELVFRAIAI